MHSRLHFLGMQPFNVMRLLIYYSDTCTLKDTAFELT